MSNKGKQLSFIKMVASGNDFIILDQRLRLRQGFGRQAPTKESAVKRSFPAGDQKQLRDLARKICDRKFGAGADGLLLLEKSKIADIKMRIFNADGSEAEMCGNGARCVTLYVSRNMSQVTRPIRNIKLETKAGIIESQISGDNIKIKLTPPKEMKLSIPIMANGRALKVNFVNTGVPHVVIFVEGIEKIDVDNLGREIRYHEHFKPAGANVNFVEVKRDFAIKVRTYERGVEAETLACGTGSVASAVITAYNLQSAAAGGKMNVLTKSGETLKVYFNKSGDTFSDVWLEGKAKIVYDGRYYV